MRQQNIPTEEGHVITDPGAWVLEDLPEGGWAIPTLWKIRPTVIRSNESVAGSWGEARAISDLRELGAMKLRDVSDRLAVAEWEVTRVCRFCSEVFSFILPSDQYGRPTRKADGGRVYCHRECMTAHTRQHAAEEASAGKVAARKLTPVDGETLVGLVQNSIEVWEAIEGMARTYGVLTDTTRATVLTVRALWAKVDALEAEVVLHRSELEEHRARIEALEAELAKIRKA